MQILINFIAVSLRILSNSLSNVFQKKLALEKFSPEIIIFYNYLILSFLCIPILFNTNIFAYNKEFWVYAIAGGISGAICNFFMVIALKYGELSVLGPINSYKAIIGLFFGIIILHEIPNFYGFIGILLIIIGTYFLFDKFSPKVFLRKDIKFRIYALIFSAIEAVLIKKVILLSSVKTSFIVSSIFGAIFSYLIVLFNQKHFTKRKITHKHIILFILTACCFGLMTYATAFVFQNLKVGYALSLFQISIIINVFLGYKLFNEKHILKKLMGSLIILIGSATIFLFGH